MEQTKKRTTQWIIKTAAILAICIALLVGIALAYPAENAGAAELAAQTITISDATVNRGAEFEVDVSIGNNEQGIQAILLYVTFNPNVMTLVDITPVNPVENENWAADFIASGKDPDETYASYGVRRMSLNWTGKNKWFGEGKIATLRFVSKSSAEPGEYKINVEVDPDSTLLSIGEKRTLAVSGGNVTMLPGKYKVTLKNATGDIYATYESNDENDPATIEKALATRAGLTPGKDADTGRYTYTFRGWDEVVSGDHAVFVPTYTAHPISHDITFNVGVLDDGEAEIRYDGANVSSHTVTLPYAKIINFDAEVPETFSPYYSFHGWYTDATCETPVTFVTMPDGRSTPDGNTTVYGYFGVNVDDPSVTTTTLEIKTSYVKEGGDDYVIAIVAVKDNYGVNSIRFAPAFDAEKLEFVGFRYSSESPFFSKMSVEYPPINDAIKSGENVENEWQVLAENESIAGKYFLFLNVYANDFTTGDLLELKFKVKAEGSSNIGLSIGDRDVTRYDATGACYYANALVNAATASVVRVVKPTPRSSNQYTYDPTGVNVTYSFENAGGESYYNLTGQTFGDAGNNYKAVVTLKETEGTLVTWEDGTVAPLEFPYVVLPFVVTEPVPTNDVYTYDGTPKHFAFTTASTVHSEYYAIAGDERTTAGTYEGEDAVTVTLNNTTNFIWEGGTTGPLSFRFVIGRIKVVKPTEYADNEKTYTFNPGNIASYNNEGENVTYEFKTEDNASKAYYTVTGNVQKKANENGYTVTVSLDDKTNTEWDDGDLQTTNVANLTFTFKINKFLITPLTVDDKVYNGTLQTASVILPENAPYTVTQNAGGEDLGAYDVVFTIDNDNFANYGWNNSDYGVISPDGKSVTVLFHIAADANVWTVEPYAVDPDPNIYTKIYDGTAVPVGAKAKYGEVVVKYRLQSQTDEPYMTKAPVDAGAYVAMFSVDGTESYNALTKDVPFVISKVRLNKPQAYAAAEKTYTYTGEPITYVFKQAGNAEAYDVTDNVQTNANVNGYTVTVSIKEDYKANYIWKGEGGDPDTSDDLTYSFVIGKQQIPVPVAADKQYIYNGSEQTFEFTAVEYSERYSIIGNKKTLAGSYTVIARIENEKKANYEWVGGTTDDQTFPFEIKHRSLSATTTAEENNFTVTLSSALGFAANSTFVASKSSPNAAEILASIASKTKKGALGQLTDEAAAALVVNKCFVASLVLNLEPAATGSIATEIELPVLRTGIVVLRFVGDDVEVFVTEQNGTKVTFTADGVYNYVILADHDFVYEVATPDYLVSDADCTHPAIYYLSCSCGATNGVDTFEYGEAQGHDYDFDHIVWSWSVDHLSATATVVCSRNEAHVLVFEGEDVTITVENNVPAALDRNGRIERKAKIVYQGTEYFSEDVEIIPAGHIYTTDPVWPDLAYVKKSGTSSIKATFICDCGESVVVKDASVTMEETATELIFTAKVIFQGEEYQRVYRIEHPVAIFDFVDGKPESGVLMLPGETVVFIDETGHERENYLFIGWRDENGALISVGYQDYKIGLTPLRFTAEWKKLTTVDVAVTDIDGEPIAGATVALYENGNPKYASIGSDEMIPNYSALTGANGAVVFPEIPYGNYRLVVSYPYLDGVDIVRSTYIDVTEENGEGGVRLTVVLPKTKFNTVVEGIGSAEGLDGAISEEEKTGISDGTGKGTVNKIVITQRRSITDVTEEVKDQIKDEVGQTAAYARGELVDFYDVTLWKTTTIRNEDGDQYTIDEQLSTAVSYQTNIFPITTAMREQILAFNGSVDNIFVFKRHEYAGNVVVVYNLPKYNEAEGEKAETECFFIKRVAGQEYIAIRQKEYSVLAFGVSPDPILILNKITSLSISDRTYGDTTPYAPVVKALYFEETATFEYRLQSATDDDYTAEKPVNAGNYYVKAFIKARDGYGAAEAVYTFTIYPKKIAEPAKDPTTFVYNGALQTYSVQESEYYTVSNNKQVDANTYLVTISLKDKKNTVWESGLTDDLIHRFEIQKKKLTDVGNITFEDKKFWFNGKKHSIEISGDLPEGVTVQYIGNDESELGKFTVTAVFSSTNSNYDISDPMTAVMNIRLNWIPIVILIVIALLILIVVIVIVEKMLKKEKTGETPPGGGTGGDAPASSDGQQNAEEEGSNND